MKPTTLIRRLRYQLGAERKKALDHKATEGERRLAEWCAKRIEQRIREQTSRPERELNLERREDLLRRVDEILATVRRMEERNKQGIGDAQKQGHD